ncbi:MAG: HDOD domain-containing protein [Nitrospirota bacterium]|nr:HDOD domain-containing protein [Nitrospirota bacterium]
MEIIQEDLLIKKAGDLKVLPFVARKMLDTIGKETVTIDELGSIIEKDQTIAARILKIANSPFYGLRSEVTSINHAILILGLRTIRSLVLSVSTKAIYKRFGITEQKIWEHSVGAAIGAKIISAGLGDDISEVAFTGGLMHDIGKVIMNNETPEVFSEVMMKTYNDGVDATTAEDEIYGYNHANVGAKVAEKWGLASTLVEIIGKHHLISCKLEEIEDKVLSGSLASVNLADFICRFLGIGFRSADDTIVLHKLPSAIFLNVGKDRLDSLVNEIHEAYNNEKSAFE